MHHHYIILQSRKAGGGRGKKSAFTKSFKLSPELADVVGSDVMPRHEVVKKLWAVIKERELQDPANKQYAICDDQLFKVIGKTFFFFLFHLYKYEDFKNYAVFYMNSFSTVRITLYVSSLIINLLL